MTEQPVCESVNMHSLMSGFMHTRVLMIMDVGILHVKFILRWVGGLIAHFWPCTFSFDASPWFLATTWHHRLFYPCDLWTQIHLPATDFNSDFLTGFSHCHLLDCVAVVTLHG